MAFRHRLQARRFEWKYVVSERCARAIRDFLKGYLEPDQYAQGDSSPSYLVYSLYLDTPTLALFRQTRGGLKNRFKLRIRFYDGDPTHPVFLEVKRREADVIYKERAAVTREDARLLLDGGWPGTPDPFRAGHDSKDASALECFRHLRDEIGARATAFVGYLREAYVSPTDDRLRITFDRGVRGTEFGRHHRFEPPRERTETNVGGVILEIKFTDCFPGWLTELVQAFDLQRRSVPKYVHCVKALGLRPEGWLGAMRERVT